MVAVRSLITLFILNLVSSYTLVKSIKDVTMASKPSLNQNYLQYPKQSRQIAMVAHSSAISKSAINAVSKLLSTCGIGVLATRQGYLDKTAIEVLSKLVFNLFQPCLLFVNIVSTVAGGVGGNAVAILPFAGAMNTRLTL